MSPPPRVGPPFPPPRTLRSGRSLSIEPTSEPSSSFVLDQEASSLIQEALRPIGRCCPFCPREKKPFATIQSCQTHLISQHLSGPGRDLMAMDLTPLESYLRSAGRWICLRHLHFGAKIHQQCSKCLREGVESIIGEEVIIHRPQVSLAVLDIPQSGPFLPYDEIPEVFKLIRQSPVVTIPNIQWSTRSEVGELYRNLLESVNDDPSNLNKIALLHMFPKCILRYAPMGSDNIRSSQKSYTRMLVKKWESGPDGQRELFNEVLGTQAHTAHGSNLSARNKRRCIRHMQHGRFAAASKALTSHGVEEVNEAMIADLESKHPPRVDPVSRASEKASFTVCPEAMESSLRSFPKDTACGADGLRAKHMIDMLDGAKESRRKLLLKAFTAHAQVLVCGDLAHEASIYLGSAPIIPLKKPKGGIRPIAVGEIWRRLVSKICMKEVREKAVSVLQPYQVGVATPNGAEAILHATSGLVRKHGDDSEWVMLKIDLKNAFNKVSRKALFEAVRLHVPKISAWVEYIYAEEPLLWLKDVILFSSEGVQQGDPLGPLLFALTLHLLVTKISADCPLLALNGWYLDDGTIIGPRSEVRKALAIIQELGPGLGCHVNMEKCELWWPTLDAEGWPEFPTDILRIVGDGVELLGGPVGGACATETIVHNRLDKIETLLKTIVTLDDPHVELLLLRYCAGMPKFMFALRTTHPSFMEATITRFTSLIDMALTSIVGVSLNSQRRLLAGLPVRSGGLGITCADRVALSAYLGSMVDSMKIQLDLLHGQNVNSAIVDELISEWNLVCNTVEPVTLAKLTNLEDRPAQSYLTDFIHKNTLSTLQATGDINFKALLSGLSLNGTAAWTNVLPIRGLQQTMEPEAFRAALKFHLGLPVYNGDVKCCFCKGRTDCGGIHSSTCPGEHVSAHNAIRDFLETEARRAHLRPVVEKTNLLPDSKQRPADVFLPNFANGKGACVDVTIVSSYGDIVRAAEHPGWNIDKARDRKKKDYDARCREEGWEFIPFVIETLGGLEEGCLKVLEFIANPLSEIDRVSKGTALHRLKSKISFLWHRELGSVLADQRRFSSSIAYV